MARKEDEIWEIAYVSPAAVDDRFYIARPGYTLSAPNYFDTPALLGNDPEMMMKRMEAKVYETFAKVLKSYLDKTLNSDSALNRGNLFYEIACEYFIDLENLETELKYIPKYVPARTEEDFMKRFYLVQITRTRRKPPKDSLGYFLITKDYPYQLTKDFSLKKIWYEDDAIFPNIYKENAEEIYKEMNDKISVFAKKLSNLFIWSWGKFKREKLDYFHSEIDQIFIDENEREIAKIIFDEYWKPNKRATKMKLGTFSCKKDSDAMIRRSIYYRFTCVQF